MDEIWKIYKQTSQRIYEISNFGNARSITLVNRKIKLLKLKVDPQGRYYITVAKKTERIHRLVALLFIGERPDGLDIDHKDRNQLNNRVDNLHYVTRQQNCMNRTTTRCDILETDPVERKKIRNMVNMRIKRKSLIK